jgi:hypothetical protein
MATTTQPQMKDASETHFAYRHVLVPLDGDPLFERVLPYVERITERPSAYVTLPIARDQPRSETGVFVPGLGYNPLALRKRPISKQPMLWRISSRSPRVCECRGSRRERAPLSDEPRR